MCNWNYIILPSYHHACDQFEKYKGIKLTRVNTVEIAPNLNDLTFDVTEYKKRKKRSEVEEFDPRCDSLKRKREVLGTAHKKKAFEEPTELSVEEINNLLGL